MTAEGRGLPRILVLVLSIDREPWRTIEHEGQRRTWAAPEHVPPGCRVVFYYGRAGAAAHVGRAVGRLARTGEPLSRRALRWMSERGAAAEAALDGPELRTHVPEAYAFTLPKLLAAVRCAASGAAGAFDYVYRTNTSAYVDLPALRVAAAALPRQGCYAGFLGRPPAEGPPFVKGAGILLSRDVVAEVAETDRPWPWGTTDDAALGRFLAAQGLEPIPMQRVLLRAPEDVAAIAEDELRSAALFRCKGRGAVREDHLTMLALHERLRGAA